MKKIMLCCGVVIVIFSQISSCAPKVKESREGEVVTYKDRRKRVIPYIIIGRGDTIYNGIAKYYYPNGKKSDEISYVLNKKLGWQSSYDTFGKLVRKTFYKNDIVDGFETFFNRKEQSDSEKFYVGGKLYFSKQYYANGQLKVFTAMNNSVPFYAVEFDSLGTKKFENGYAFSLNESCFYPNIDQTRVGQEMVITIPIVAIPGYQTTVRAAKFDSSGSMLGNTDSLPVFKYYAVYKTKFDKAGKYRIGLAGTLRNDKGELLRSDTLFTNIVILPR